MLEQLTPYLPQDPLFHSLAILGILAALSILAFWVTEKIIIKLLSKMFKKTSTQLDDILVCLQKVLDKSGIEIREGFRSRIPLSVR